MCFSFCRLPSGACWVPIGFGRCLVGNGAYAVITHNFARHRNGHVWATVALFFADIISKSQGSFHLGVITAAYPLTHDTI